MQWTESGGLNRAGLLLVGLASIACLACEVPQGASPHSEPLPKGALASVPEAESEEVEIYPGSTPQVVQLARVHGYGNPSTGELWIKPMEQAQAAEMNGIAGQAHAVSGFCAQVTEGLGADNNPNTHPASGFEFFTVPEPGGCEDSDFDGVPDDNPMVCNDGMFGGVAFNAFDQSTCEGRLPAGADARAGGTGAHSTAFTTDGVGCARQRVGNYTDKTFSRVFLDIDIFNGDPTHYPYGFPFALGEDVDGTPDGSAQGAVATPITGRARPDGALGLWDFGAMAPGETADMWIFFRNGDANDFTFTGFILGEIVEDCGDNDDDDCDGINDNGCFDQAYGATCYHDDDCSSTVCTGEAIVSLLGAAAEPANGLDDDTPGMCDSICSDSTIEGPEECDDGGNTPLDGCDESCFVEPGYAFPLWGPVDVDSNTTDDTIVDIAADGASTYVIFKEEVPATDADWVIAKIDPEGNLDTAWGNSGFSDAVDINPGDPTEAPACMGVLSTGRLVAAGATNATSEWAIAAWDPDGTLSGTRSISTGAIETLADCAVTTNDELLVYGTTYNPNTFRQDQRVIMFDPFDGTIITSWAMGSAFVAGMGVIDAVSQSQIVDEETFTLGATTFEFDPDGDGLFNGGAVEVDIAAAVSEADVADAIVSAVNGAALSGALFAQREGNSVVLIHRDIGTKSATESVADAGFAIQPPLGGSVLLNIDGVDEIARTMAVDSSDNIVLVSQVGDAMVTRLTAAGDLDTDFGPFAGHEHLGVGDVAADVAVQGTGIAIVGTDFGGFGYVALLDGGGLDTTFNGTGTQVTGSVGNIYQSVGFDAAGDVIAGGTTDGTSIMVTRYIAATGLVDSSNGFNVSGTYFDGTAPSAVAIETQGSGDIVVGGVSTNADDDLYIIHLAQ